MRRIYLILLLLLLSVAGQAQSRVDSIRARLFDPNDSRVMVIAHRGDWRYACENSIEAVENAIKMGVDIVEIDIARTKDSVLIVMHDATVDRTTTGKGRVAELTWEQIKELKLRNGCFIRTKHSVPTLEQMLVATKGRIMFNLDRAFDYYDQIYDLLEKTGTTHQIIIKGDAPATEVKRLYGDRLDKMIYMPKVNIDDPLAMQKLDSYLTILKPVAIEFKYAHDTNPLPLKVKQAMAGKAHIWYNTLWDTHAGGHDDDCSLTDPDRGYGYLIDTLGATMLQTDRPQYLIDYIKKREL